MYRFAWITVPFIATLLAAAYCAHAADTPPGDATELFERRIRPLLVSQCFRCHAKGEDSKGGLQLINRDAMLAGGDRGPAIVPGDAEHSLLISAVRHTNDELKMPPSRHLADHEIDDLTKWINAGAPWPAVEPPAGEQSAALWSLAPIAEAAPPPVNENDWCTSEIDHFVLARLEEKGLKHAPRADKRTWLRRVSFDLVGLPPTPAQIESFLNDESPDADAAVVDRLLASPHYGERWARHWMDLMRYAETNGYDYNRPKANAYRYRDYCIDAFNRDVPYDQFVREHIAGDLLPERLSADGNQVMSNVATGTWWFQEIQDIVVDWPTAQAEEMENQIDVVSKAFLGLTLACARCHDHKFDPLTTRDYYALAGLIQSSTNIQRCIDSPSRTDGFTRLRPRIEEIDRAIQGLLDKARCSPAAMQARRAEAEKIRGYLLATRELAESGMAPTAEQVATLAAQHNLQAEHLQRWLEEISQALQHRDRLFRPWMRLSRATPDVFSYRRETLDRQIALCEQQWELNRPRVRVLGEFESDGFDGWHAEGPAFANGPQTNPPTGVFGYSGRGYADSFHGSNAWTGRLTSPRFRLESSKQRIGLLIAGGNNPRTTRVNVLVHSQALPQADDLSFTGDNSDAFTLKMLPIPPPFVGRDAMIEVIDSEQGDWGHILLDRVVLIDPPPAEAETFDSGGRGYNSLTRGLLGRTDLVSAEAMAGAYQELFLRSLDAWEHSLAAHLQGEGSSNHGLAGCELLEQRIASAEQREIVAWTLRDQSLLLNNQQLESCLSSEDQDKLSQLRSERAALEADVPPSAFALTMAEAAGHDTPVQRRGNPHSPGEIAPRGYVEVLCPHPAPVTQGSGRLEFSQWLTASNNPLVARVLVNRVWQHHFGTGIVATSDNFGEQGEAPTHPELLDYLARRFINSGWSIKELHKTLLLSSTYRQSDVADPAAATLDPDNRLLHHVAPRRLEAECIRDAVLAVAGDLDPRMYGPGDNPLPAKVIPSDQASVSTDIDGSHRRTIYLEVRRGAIPRFLTLFDFPKPDSCVGRRAESIVPLQALNLLNDKLIVEEARSWGMRIDAELRPDAERVRAMYVAALGRPPLLEEGAAALRFLTAQQARYAKIESDLSIARRNSWIDLCHLMFNLPEFIFVR